MMTNGLAPPVEVFSEFTFPEPFLPPGGLGVVWVGQGRGGGAARRRAPARSADVWNHGLWDPGGRSCFRKPSGLEAAGKWIGQLARSCTRSSGQPTEVSAVWGRHPTGRSSPAGFDTRKRLTV